MTSPTTDPTTGQPTATDPLARWRDVGRRLWPFVRYFGLCGADPAATEAVRDLGELLGIDGPAGPLAREQAGQVREQAIHDTLAAVEAGLRGRMLSREIEPFCDRIRQSLENPAP